MKHFLLLLVSLCLTVTTQAAEGDEQTSYMLTSKVVLTQQGKDKVDRLYILMPVPQTNEYQEVLKVGVSNGIIIEEHRCDNKLLRLDINYLPRNPFEFYMEIFANPIPVRTDFTKIGDIRPYNPESLVCQRHLGSMGSYIDTTNETVTKLGDELWAESSDIVDYARRCYEYVAKNFEVYENNDWHSLSRVLKNAGGGPFDLSSLVISLLRYKGIPSRHNVCATLSQDYYAFVDFYLEGYGWIPVDVAKKSIHPDEDCFGVYDGSCIVLSQDIGYDITVYRPQPITILPTFFCYFTATGEDCSLSAVHYLQNNGITGIHTVTAESQSGSDNSVYNLQGQKVPSTYKGLVIRNGRKYIQK